MYEMKLFILGFFIICFAFVLTVVADPGGPEVEQYIYYLAAWDGSPTYSDGYYKLGNDLRVSTLVDLKNDDNGYLPIILEFDVPVYGNPNGTGDPSTTAITVVDVQRNSDSSLIPNHDVTIERVNRLEEEGTLSLRKILVDIKIPRSLFDDLPITVRLNVSENAVYSDEGVGNVVYASIELNIVTYFPTDEETPSDAEPPEVEQYIYYLAAWDGSPTYSDGYYKLGNDLRVSTLVDLKNDDNGYLPIILEFDVPIYGNPNGTGDPTTTAITVVDVQRNSDSSLIPNHGLTIEKVSRLEEGGTLSLRKLLADIKVPRSLFDDLPITVRLNVSENAVYSAEGVGNIAYGPIELNIVENFPSETPTFTRPTSDERKVKLIYFLPKDRSFNSQIPIVLDTQIKEAQSFYAENMALHGFGQKTFKIETDGNGTAVVHNFIGEYDGVYYHTNALSKTSTEIKKRFDTSTDVYLIVLDTSIESIDGNCGISYSLGGPAIVPANGGCFRDRLGYILIAHELGHAFNLVHDFRDSSYLMSGSYTANKLSTCAARVLDINPFFNQDTNTIQTSNHHGQIRMVTESVYPLNGQHFTVKFEITDEDGIYQAQLLFPRYVINPEIQSDDRGLYDCRNFENAPSRETVEFYVPSEFLKYPTNNILIRVFDQYGNVTQKILTLISTKTFESAKSNNTGTFLTLTYHDPNALVPINDKKEWAGWGDNLWEKTPDRRLSEKPQPFIYNVFFDAYNYWFYAHAQSSIIYDLSKGNYTKFEAFLLLPNPCESTSVELICLADDVEIYNSGVLSGSQVHNKRILSDIPEDTQMFTIRITDAGDGIRCDHFVLANARLFDADTPVPVSLSFFRPTLENGEVIIRWTTESELDNAGFNILRSIDLYGEYKQVNTQLIQGAGTTGKRNTYKWVDTTAKPDVAYYYQIQDVSFAGERQVLTTTRLKGLMLAKNKLKTTWSELKSLR